MSQVKNTQESEEWRAVVGFEGIYEVSSLGRVKRLRTVVRGPHESKQMCNEKILTPNYKDGYASVRLCKNSCGTNVRIHSLVLIAFVGPRPKGMECRHFPDPNRKNNRLINLCWGTKKQNAADRDIQGAGQRGERNMMAKLTSDQVKEIRDIYAIGTFPQNKIAIMFGVNQQTVSKIVNKLRWSHV